MAEELDVETRGRLLKQALIAIGAAQGWHWFTYHFSMLPPHPLVRSIVDACAECERKLPGLGSRFIEELAKISGKEKHEPHFDQLLQKLAEVLVLRQLLSLNWPVGTQFQHEPAVSANGKRPELRVLTPKSNFLFEVKTPSLLEHIRARRMNAVQVAGRVLPLDPLKKFAGDGGLTLPRDNPVKDFLQDADAKFAQFKAVQPETSILIIVWDDFIYEPITVLRHEHCGLLTPNSYLKDQAGAAVGFPHVDAVVLVRHLTYLYRATRDEALEERAHAMDFGNDRALPNVIISTKDPELIPDFVRDGLRALPLDHPLIQRAADYRPKDVVFWF